MAKENLLDPREMLAWAESKRPAYSFGVYTMMAVPSPCAIDPEKYGNLCRAPFQGFGVALWLFSNKDSRDLFEKDWEEYVVDVEGSLLDKE